MISARLGDAEVGKQGNALRLGEKRVKLSPISGAKIQRAERPDQGLNFPNEDILRLPRRGASPRSMPRSERPSRLRSGVTPAAYARALRMKAVQFGSESRLVGARRTTACAPGPDPVTISTSSSRHVTGCV